ncbi:MAG: nucleotidyltransferase domain-containing protein [Candidatus Aenigmarchaeota archaeon]|nr:nucleotidyltransferase domain-containing protein [Candidatus Aenigmarchaeota archaeon]
MNKLLVAFAADFVSFLIQKIGSKHLSNLRGVILFGSVARGEATKESDVDIFLDLFREDDALLKIVPGIIEEFYSGAMFKKYWRLMGIDNEIKCVPGRLDKWKDLQPSIISEGITLFGKYAQAAKNGGKSFVIITWEKVRPESKRVFLSKKLFGYSLKGKMYKGVLDGTGTVKLGSSCLLVPVENSTLVMETFKNMKVCYKTFHVSSLI